MRSKKRVILMDGPRLLREMLHRVIDKADHLQVIDEVPQHRELSSSIERFDPEWVIVTLPYGDHTGNWIDACMAEYPSVRFIYISPYQNQIKMKGQSSDEDYPDLSLKEFIHLLEKDLQHT